MGREQQFLKGVNSATKVYVHKVWKDEHKKLRSDLEKLKNGTPHSRYFSDELGVLNFFIKI